MKIKNTHPDELWYHSQCPRKEKTKLNVGFLLCNYAKYA